MKIREVAGAGITLRDDAAKVDGLRLLSEDIKKASIEPSFLALTKRSEDINQVGKTLLEIVAIRTEQPL